MLEYVKTILEKVSFNKRLFSKELEKAFLSLTEKELNTLLNWCYNTFSSEYHALINHAKHSSMSRV